MTKVSLWWLCAGACAALIGYLSVVPVDDAPSVTHADKLMHLGAYLVLAWIVLRAVRTTLAQKPLRAAWLSAAGYGALIELVQGVLPWRSAELADLVMNALGAALGVWIGRKAPRS